MDVREHSAIPFLFQSLKVLQGLARIDKVLKSFKDTTDKECLYLKIFKAY